MKDIFRFYQREPLFVSSLCFLRCRFCLELLFSYADTLNQLDLSRADIGAGTAFDAVRKTVFYGIIQIVCFERAYHHYRCKSARAGVYTSSAADTYVFLLQVEFVFAEKEYSRRVFLHWEIRRHHRNTHHRTAVYYFAYAGLKLYNFGNQVADKCTHRNNQVLWLFAMSARNRKTAFYKWLSQSESVRNGGECADVLNNAACVSRKLTGRNFALYGGFYEHFFTALRVLGFYKTNRNAGKA